MTTKPPLTNIRMFHLVFLIVYQKGKDILETSNVSRKPAVLKSHAFAHSYSYF